LTWEGNHDKGSGPRKCPMIQAHPCKFEGARE
jgi:hypothetical protein